ncbi:Glutathione S-transferase T3 [Glycine soja]|uniref:No apical meristem-associated C-terminal domain-containing protein n=2 Tax=Glycine subgen. Soja TaxID=1462606 RepID=A0A0R0KFP2_SOYBN|nr:hypothetical protein JHK87_006428 [Glycine soja]RZC19445.1 Glutathione S-transferase T3 [Glycine soja]
MDPIVGDCQSRDYFWLIVTKYYNNFCGNLQERKLNQMKSRWQKINVGVQKFKGHYKQAVDLKKNGYTKNDVMIHAYAIWKKDKGSNFTSEHAWRLLKDKPKWGSKNLWRKKKNEGRRRKKGKSCDTRPMGQKAAKRKIKRKEAAMSSSIVDLSIMKVAINEKIVVNKRIAEAKETENIAVLYEILVKNTSTMSEE